MARLVKGTRCSLPDFIRSPWIVQTSASRSKLFHSAPWVSPVGTRHQDGEFRDLVSTLSIARPRRHKTPAAASDGGGGDGCKAVPPSALSSARGSNSCSVCATEPYCRHSGLAGPWPSPTSPRPLPPPAKLSQSSLTRHRLKHSHATLPVSTPAAARTAPTDRPRTSRERIAPLFAVRSSSSSARGVGFSSALVASLEENPLGVVGFWQHLFLVSGLRSGLTPSATN